jgi:phage-related minor tail protein
MASRSLGVLTLDLVTKTAGFVSGFGTAEKTVAQSAKRINAQLSNLKKSFVTLFAGASIIAAVRTILHETVEAEDAIKQVEARLKSTGGVSGFTAKQLQLFADEMQRLTTFSGEAVLAIETVLLAFTNIRGETLKGATRAILDLSVAMKQDLQASAVQVGKALQDPIKGLTSLQRVGISFSASQQEIIKRLAQTGHVASAQNVVLDELQKKFGGAAEAAAGTLGGALQQLGNAFGDLLKVRGALPQLTGEVQALTTTLSDPQTRQNIDDAVSAMVTFLIGAKDLAGFLLTPAIKTTSWFVELVQSAIDKAKGLKEIFVDRTLAENIQRWLYGGGRGMPLGPDSAAPTPAPFEAAPDPEALEKINDLIDGLRKNIAAFDQGSAAAMRYAVAHGDLAEELAKTVKLAPELTAELIRLSGLYEEIQSKKAIKDMTDDLREQIALLGHGESAAIRYRVEHGELAKILGRTGKAGEQLKRELVALTDALALAQIEQFTKSLRDQVETYGMGEAAVMRYRIQHGDLKEQFAAGGEEAKKFAEEIIELTAWLEDFKAAEDLAADAVSNFAQEVSDSLGLNLDRFLESFEKRFLETRDVLLDFLQGLASGTEDVIADSLISGFEGGAKGILKSFGELMKQLIARAVAADLAKRIFGTVAGGTGTGWLGALAGVFGIQMTPKAVGGSVMAGVPYLVGERGPEVMVPSRSGVIVPNNKIGGQTNYITLTIQTPTGRIPLETQQQLGNRVARALGDARRRNG